VILEIDRNHLTIFQSLKNKVEEVRNVIKEEISETLF